ncbi:hypothetical protein [Psychroserpens sp. SPM9]|uniref:hypothetical protein n=1 Tax=Psychroserpens sp. SPM9 TaxID=2975598 RepID=UPI0021A5B66F|nr:hypothetical protein [Psychroserpens sp. SPM9]MDG5491386.1 hypothetical protein [Psychroserpens sp. SPM9]
MRTPNHPSTYLKRGFYYVLFLCCVLPLSGQESCYKTSKVTSLVEDDRTYQIFDMIVDSCDSKRIKTAYFGQDAYKKYKKIQDNHNIHLVASASFTSSFDMEEGHPVGFCAENGKVFNKMPSDTMDGLVLLNNNEGKIDTIEIIDLDENLDACNPQNCDKHIAHYNLRDKPSDTYHFLKFIDTHKISSFQTQLVFSKYKTDAENFAALTHGLNDKGRRFLAICSKNNSLRHVIVDDIEADYLMSSAKRVIGLLRENGYDVEYMINLDTGSKDIIHASNGYSLQNLRPNPQLSYATLENATSLLVYYSEK